MLIADNETANYSEVKGSTLLFKSVDSEIETGSNVKQASKSNYRVGINTARIPFVLEHNFKSWNIEDDLSDTKNTAKSGAKDIPTGEELTSKVNPIKTIRNLYFQDEFITPELRTGINLLEISQNYITKSLESIRQSKRKESDEFIMQFKVFLPELFCCRTISESFGAVVNAIQNALSHMNGCPLSENQLIALHEIITGLLREPAMSFEKAVDYVSDFEEADFEVESVGLEGLLKLTETMDEDETELING
jgi:hypothetical protein